MVQPAYEFDADESSGLSATEDDLMCNYYPRDTGLSGLIVNAMQRGKMQHGPRLKVAIREKLGAHDFDAVVTISDQPFIKEGALPPVVARQVFAFIVRNRDVLQQLWDEDLSCTEAATRFVRG